MLKGEESVYEMVDETEYEVVEEKGLDEGEDVYHVPEDAREGETNEDNEELAYEVPIQSNPEGKEGEGTEGKDIQAAYSTLQYN